jgi:hypothetical protein
MRTSGHVDMRNFTAAWQPSSLAHTFSRCLPRSFESFIASIHKFSNPPVYQIQLLISLAPENPNRSPNPIRTSTHSTKRTSKDAAALAHHENRNAGFKCERVSGLSGRLSSQSQPSPHDYAVSTSQTTLSRQKSYNSVTDVGRASQETIHPNENRLHDSDSISSSPTRQNSLCNTIHDHCCKIKLYLELD